MASRFKVLLSADSIRLQLIHRNSGFDTLLVNSIFLENSSNENIIGFSLFEKSKYKAG
jgi:hypothetical protein